jgi:hypothetical protein
MTTNITTTDQPTGMMTTVRKQQIIEIDQFARQSQLEIATSEAEGNRVLKALSMARAIQGLRDLLTKDVVADLMILQGTKLGFLTDKDKTGGYELATVRDVAIEAIIRGFRLVGNEVNIIAGRFYPTREGFERVVREWPGVSAIDLDFEVPEIHGDSARIAGTAQWTLNGRRHLIERMKTATRDLRIPVRVNNGMGVDAVLGKARAKMYRLIHERLTGLITDLQTDEPEPETLEPSEPPVAAITRPANEQPELLNADPNNPLDQWGKEASRLVDAIDNCTDREQLEKIYKDWLPYANTAGRKSQFLEAMRLKADSLGVKSK